MTPRHPHVTGAVLAGGLARRMAGADKGLLPLAADRSDTPLARILSVFSGRFAACLIVTGPGAPADTGAYLAMGASAGLPVTLTSDRIEGKGPLGGIHAALAESRTPFVFACGCDMPGLSAGLLDLMATRAAGGRLLVPVLRGRPEPLHAIYPVSCREEAGRALRDGVTMMLDFFQRVPVDYLPEEQYAHIPGAASSFVNLNTPADLGDLR